MEYTSEIITLALRLAALVSVALFTKVIYPWLKQQRLYGTITKCVQAAEKMAEAGTLPKKEKKDFVIERLKENGITITSEIDVFIESAVKELDWMAGEITDLTSETAKDDDS